MLKYNYKTISLRYNFIIFYNNFAHVNYNADDFLEKIMRKIK